jgi:pantothenate synthetase
MDQGLVLPAISLVADMSCTNTIRRILYCFQSDKLFLSSRNVKINSPFRHC